MNDTTHPTCNNPRVLLVEDNDNDVELTKLAFAAAETDVDLICVGDGEQCMATLRQSDASELPDLILLDLHMPRMDGLEVLQALSRDAILKNIPVVVLTTSDAPEDVDAAYRAGCKSFVQKPIGFDAFVRLIAELTQYWFDTVTLPSRMGCAERAAEPAAST